MRLIRTPNRGLSSARNTGLAAATGRDRRLHRRRRLPGPALAELPRRLLRRTRRMPASAGPNIAAGRRRPRRRVRRATRRAARSTCCSPTTRPSTSRAATWRSAREALAAIGGFDPQFRAAGDDVDVCWRLHERGWTLGFSPAAMVWHHRRDSVRALLAPAARLRQGRGAARAKVAAEVQRRRPSHLDGAAVRNGAARTRRCWRRWRIYHGTWGTGSFQSIYQPAAGFAVGAAADAGVATCPDRRARPGRLLGAAVGAVARSPALAMLAVAVGALLATRRWARARASDWRRRPRRERARLRATTAVAASTSSRWRGSPGASARV